MNDNECVYCGSHNTTRHEEDEAFIYGVKGRPEISVTANVVVSGCIDCGQQWTDGDQEQIRSDAACMALYAHIESLEAENARLMKVLRDPPEELVLQLADILAGEWSTGSAEETRGKAVLRAAADYLEVK